MQPCYAPPATGGLEKGKGENVKYKFITSGEFDNSKIFLDNIVQRMTSFLTQAYYYEAIPIMRLELFTFFFVTAVSDAQFRQCLVTLSL